jgi:3-oxoacyl-[acyl-carrier protein] reductase
LGRKETNAVDIAGKVAIVTGSATGMGRATALMLAEQGCNVVVNYTRSEAEALETAADVELRGAKALLSRADVSSDEECREMVQATVDAFGRVDVLVNNAGATFFVPHADLDALTEDMWDRTFAVNVKGTFFMSRAVAAPMRATGNGAIVNVSSTAGVRAGGSSIAYAASKAAVINLTVSLARALAPEIRVNCVAPGFIDTRWLAQGYGERFEAMREAQRRNTPLRDAGQPEHMAQVVLSAITGMDWVTGQTIVADGGNIIRL